MSSEITNNRKALHDFRIDRRIETGIELRGTEVKSIRAGLVNLRGSYARIENAEIFLFDTDIQPYLRASHEQHEAKRKRRLLVHRREIAQLQAETEQEGKTLVPLRLYWKQGRVKVEIGVGKGKVASDKRADLKRKDAIRETDREIAGFQRKRER